MSRRARIYPLLAAGLAALLVGTLAPPAHASHTTEPVPYRMDGSNQAGWWSPMDEYNGSQYVAYNAWGGPGPTNGGDNDTHTVYVAKRTPDGTWTRGCLRVTAGAGCVVYGDDVGHNQPSVAVDGDGYIHAFVSMHNDDWRYYRSTAPGDVTTLVNRSAEMPDGGLRYTYPNVTRGPDGDVYLIIRVYPTWPGPGHGRLFRWDDAADTWSRVATFAAQNDWVVYPNDITEHGGELHIAWEWAYLGANGLRHLGSYMVYDPATGGFRNAAGSAVSVPATTTSPVVYRPLGGHDDINCRDAPTCPGVQSAKFAIDPATGNPLVAYRYRSNHGYPYRVWLAEWTGSGWNNSLVYRGDYDTYAALDITVADGVTRVYYAKKDTLAPNQAHVATRQPGGGWSEHALLSGVRVERLSVVEAQGTDYLYLAAPDTRELHFGTYERAGQQEQGPATGFEDRNGASWTTHDEELAFLDAVDAASERMEYSVIGESVQGRPLHVVRVGHPRPPPDPDIAAGRSMLVVGSQHGNEPAGREAALQLLRDLTFTADPAMVDYLSETTVLFIPSANPDGRVADTRGNADGTDTNRDHLNLATPEGQAVAGVLRAFAPDISVDTHERPPRASNPDIDVLWPANPNVDEQLWWVNADLIQNYVRAGIEAAGFTTGLFATETAGQERILRNVFALRHGLGMLTETMWEDPPLHRVDVQMRAVEQVLRFHREHGDAVADEAAGSAARKAAAGADQSEPFYLAGAIGESPPPASAVLDPPPCGYLLHSAQADQLDPHTQLFSLETEQVSGQGVFVTMAQPMMTVVPLLLDERASYNEVDGLALDDCSDPGSVEPPPPPPPPTEPAQHATDFAGDPVGQPPAGWSSAWRNSNWTVLDGPPRLRHTASGDGRRALTWDQPGDGGQVRGDVEVSGLVRVPSPLPTTRFQLGLHASGGAGSENAYYLDVRAESGSDLLRIMRYQNGSVVELGRATLPSALTAGAWYHVVLQRDGTALRAKLWADGTSEPSGWQVATTDPSFDEGRVGVSHFIGGAVNEWSFIGVGTGGEPAPRGP